MAARQSAGDELQSAPAFSLAFWICLFVAAGLYGAVALAPRMYTNLQLRKRHYTNQVQLVNLEKQVHYLQRVAHALEHEPAFSSELARIDFDAVRPGDERIEIKSTLRLGTPWPKPVPSVAGDRTRWYEPFLILLAQEGWLRYWILGVAAMVTISAFTFFQEVKTTPQLRAATGMVRSWRDWLARRYRKPPHAQPAGE